MSKKYEIAYVDFPVPYTSFGTAKLPYKTMPWHEIANFDWSVWLAKRAIVFSWATGPMLEKSMLHAASWAKYGLFYQGVAYVWVKTKADGTPIKASGPRPRLVKPLDEFLLAYSTTPNERTFPLLTEKQVQHQFFPKQSVHSRKPGEFRDLIVELLGDRPRVELFARERVEGWDAWGDEL